MQLRTTLLLTLLAGATGCASLHTDADRQWIQNRKQQWADLNEQKSLVNRHGKVAQEFKLGDNGTMVVWNWSLDGGPEWEYLRMRVTWRNTTKKKHDYARLWLAIMDADGRTISRSSMVISHPLGKAWTPGSSYTDEIRTPMHGAHMLKKGWYWKVGAEALGGNLFDDGTW